MMANREDVFERIQAAGMPDAEFEASVTLGESIGKQILVYASEDNYHQSRSFEKYTIRNDPGSWRPTPPAYMEGIEPHWNKIRTFFGFGKSIYSASPTPI